MMICKEARVGVGGVPDAAQLEKINAQSKTPLTAEQVYCFRVQLCDDQVDRDFERFDAEALPELARLFVGKTGICDHSWSAGQQLARIFDTEVVRQDGVTSLQAWAYMLRTEKNQPVIDDIEGGIRREVSVGCAMGQSRCSVCGAPYGSCEHRKGQRYDGQLCAAVLSEPVDAYEFSFVAVPAQPAAGVLKGYAPGRTLRALVRGSGAAEAELDALEQQADAGRAYLSRLRDETVRLCLGLGVEVSAKTLQTAAEALAAPQLEQLCAALNTLARTRYPGQPQLAPTDGAPYGVEQAFLI